MNDERSKVTARHLKLNAYLYIRQSTMKQVHENKESTMRQYDLRGRALALGWTQERIVVVDCDLGRSGASGDREGFQKLVTEVGLGNAGIVLGLEVSRLARNSADWHRLIEICAVTDTLLLDEDGLYDPAHFNDRLLLGLKGTMSEAELHVLRSRMRGALVAKAKRGELCFQLPTGFVHDAAGRIVLDPDAQVQATIRLFFQTYTRVGAVHSTVKYFREQKVPFPCRFYGTPRGAQLLWEPLSFSRANNIIKNPLFAGAYAFGRHRSRTKPDGHVRTTALPRDEWIVLRRNAHQGYISWEEFERNQQWMRDRLRACGGDHRRAPSREGPGLLQGLAVCGRCGKRMNVQYHRTKAGLVPTYLCGRGVRSAEPICASFTGLQLDAAIGQLLLDKMTPAILELALAVREEIQSRLDETNRLREQTVARAQYEADLARRRFMQVDPENRLVAETLEAEWNHKLREVNEARDACEAGRRADAAKLDDAQRARIRSLATDFPVLWRDPAVPHRERKRITALLIEDVTITKSDCLTAQIRFRGGATASLSVPLPLTGRDLWATPKETRMLIDSLLAEHTAAQTVAILNERGLTTGHGEPFTAHSLLWVCHAHRIPSLRKRLRTQGLLNAHEIAAELGVCLTQVREWGASGLLKARVCNERGERLYFPVDQQSKAVKHYSARRPGGSAARGAV